MTRKFKDLIVRSVSCSQFHPTGERYISRFNAHLKSTRSHFTFWYCQGATRYYRTICGELKLLSRKFRCHTIINSYIAC